ncbi:MAG: NTP transferase domain-containing protein [Candidatus Glassbacteria bacterium]|nr:NTP transferase domain-containing protein [Candidatus Glassbacteria bacterium]
MDSVIAILQARLQSSRLPGKIMADICGRPLITHVIDRLQATPGIDRVVLAVPRDDFAELRPVAERNGAEIHPGPARDVLGRFYSTASRFESACVVRATADNPLIDPFMLSRCIEECLSGCWDMVGCRGLPLGTAAETFPTPLLELLNNCGKLSYHREHVTAYLYEHEEEFLVKRLSVPSRLRAPRLRLTVDTPEDLVLVRRVYESLYRPGRLVELEEVIGFLRDNPGLASLNSHVRQRTWKKCDRKAAVA